MQEDLEAFGVKIESNLPTQAEAQTGGLCEPGRADDHAGAREEVKGGTGKGALPEPVHVADDEVVAVGADDPVVHGGGGAVPLQGEAAGATDLKPGAQGPGFSLGYGRGGGGGNRQDQDKY
jgi:hypothetical protein